MSEDTDGIKKILDENDISVADIEFIAKYLKKENISAQLAMRQIKSFEKLQEKLDDNADKQKLKELTQELEELRTNYNSLENSLHETQGKAEDWENKANLLTSESEQLKEQLEMLQEIHMSDIEKDKEEKELLVEKISLFTSQLEEIMEHANLKDILSPIYEIVKNLSKGEEGAIDKEKFISNFESILEKSNKEYLEKNKSSFVQSAVKEEFSTIRKETKEKEYIQVDKKVDVAIKEEPKKVEKPKEEEKPEDKSVQVLQLFLDFIDEADSNDEFQKRVAAICDTDEAYEHLGSIALSQVYSFSSKDLSKKPQLVKLLKTWMKTGIPW